MRRVLNSVESCEEVGQGGTVTWIGLIDAVTITLFLAFSSLFVGLVFVIPVVFLCVVVISTF